MRLRLGAFKAPVFTAGCTLLLLMTGCSSVQMTTGDAPLSPFSTGKLAGTSLGGFAPIGGAAITLYAAGTDFGLSNGSTATMAIAPAPLASTVSDATVTSTAPASTFGSWSLSGITCPTSNPNAQLYIVSRGGYSGSVAVAAAQTSTTPAANKAAVMMALLGKCSDVVAGNNPGPISINEATTVAAVYTMNQFMNFTLVSSAYYPQIGAPADNITTTYSSSYSNYTTGLNNAYLTYKELVNNNGQIQTSFVPGNSVVGMTATPESGKEALVANMLAACVQEATYDSTKTTDGCGILFNNTAAPPNTMVHVASQASVMNTTLAANASADTLLATWYLVTNPNQGANIANEVTGPSKGTSPYAGAGTAPTDWTLGIMYTAGTNNCGTSGNSQAPFSFPYSTAVDSGGNVWVLNAPATAIGTAVKLSPSGAVAACIDGHSAVGVSTNGYSGNPLLIDVTGNVFYASPGNVEIGLSTGGNELAEYSTAGTFSTWPLPTPTANTTTYNPFVIATDHVGNIYFNGYPTSEQGFYQYTASQIAAGSATATAPTTPFLAAGGSRVFGGAVMYAGGSPYFIATGASTTYSYALVSGTAQTGLGTNSKQGPVAVGPSGTAGSASVNTSNASPSSSWMTTSTTVAAHSALFLGGLNSAGGFAIDGVNHYWASLQAPSSGTAGTASAVYGVASVFNQGDSPSAPNWIALSPAATGTTCGGSTATVCPVGGSFQHPSLVGATVGAAIDPSGNLWMGMVTGTPSTSGVFELVGATAPIVTPLAFH